MAFWIRIKQYFIYVSAILLIGSVMVPFISCKDAEEPEVTVETIEIEGTISYITLEGGFWGIIGNDGVYYDPINLVAEYAEGYTIKIQAEILEDQENIHQWGTLIKINTIEVIASPTTTINC